MVDRLKTLTEFIFAWADYEKRMSGIGFEAKKLAEGDPALAQMIARITGELSSSPELQRHLAMELTLAEFTKQG
jgi:hypothetical protein